MKVADLLIYLTPIMTGAIGWFTNWVAVKMLFKPVNPIKIGPWVLQGIFPKRQDKLAEKIGQMVANELLTSHDIKNRILQPENIQSFMQFVEQKIDQYLQTEFNKKYPIASVFISKSRKDQIKFDLMEEIMRIAPEVIETMMSDLDKRVNIEEIITQKVASLAPDKLEKLINGILKKEFKFIEISGLVLGALVGLIQVIFIELFK